jgi:hypothetical protein
LHCVELLSWQRCVAVARSLPPCALPRRQALVPGAAVWFLAEVEMPNACPMASRTMKHSACCSID